MYLIGSKAVLYPLLFQQFPINVVIIRHFNTVNRVQVFADLTRVRTTNTVESGPLCRLAKAQDVGGGGGGGVW